MTLVSTLVLATPLFGLSLVPDVPPQAPPGSILRLPIAMQLGDDQAPPEEGEAAPVQDTRVEEPPAIPPPQVEHHETNGASADEMRAYAEQLRHRQEVGSIHRVFGIATWASMLVTEVLGFIQFYNLYGFWAPRDQTPCVTGSAVFGQDQCWGTPWVHRIAAIGTTALYGATFTLSFLMPDPDHIDQGNSSASEHLRIHKILRWIHFGGMIAQILLGLAVGENWFGLDRANNYGALQAMATVHQIIGLTTFGTLTAAGLLMLF